MAKAQHYYIFFADDQFEAHEFRLQELLRFCQRRGWKKPFVLQVEVTAEGKQIVVSGPTLATADKNSEEEG